MSNKTKPDNNALEVVRLSLRVMKLENQVRALQSGDKLVEDPQAQLTKLKDAAAVIKLRNSRGTTLDGDPARLKALDVEIGKLLLQIDGIL